MQGTMVTIPEALNPGFLSRILREHAPPDWKAPSDLRWGYFDFKTYSPEEWEEILEPFPFSPQEKERILAAIFGEKTLKEYRRLRRALEAGWDLNPRDPKALGWLFRSLRRERGWPLKYLRKWGFEPNALSLFERGIHGDWKGFYRSRGMELLSIYLSGNRRKKDERSSAPKPPSFGETLRSLRESRGWSQGDLAQILGVSQSAISHWELGIHAPNFFHLRTLSRLFGKPIEEWQDWAENPFQVRYPSRSLEKAQREWGAFLDRVGRTLEEEAKPPFRFWKEWDRLPEGRPDPKAWAEAVRDHFELGREALPPLLLWSEGQVLVHRGWLPEGYWVAFWRHPKAGLSLLVPEGLEGPALNSALALGIGALLLFPELSSGWIPRFISSRTWAFLLAWARHFLVPEEALKRALDRFGKRQSGKDLLRSLFQYFGVEGGWISRQLKGIGATLPGMEEDPREEGLFSTEEPWEALE